MGDIIRFKKGLKDNLPILGIGEPGFTTNVDDQRLYIGGPNGNVAIPNMEDIDIINSQMNDIAKNKWIFLDKYITEEKDIGITINNIISNIEENSVLILTNKEYEYSTPIKINKSLNFICNGKLKFTGTVGSAIILDCKNTNIYTNLIESESDGIVLSTESGGLNIYNKIYGNEIIAKKDGISFVTSKNGIQYITCDFSNIKGNANAYYYYCYNYWIGEVFMYNSRLQGGTAIKAIGNGTNITGLRATNIALESLEKGIHLSGCLFCDFKYRREESLNGKEIILEGVNESLKFESDMISLSNIDISKNKGANITLRGRVLNTPSNYLYLTNEVIVTDNKFYYNPLVDRQINFTESAYSSNTSWVFRINEANRYMLYNNIRLNSNMTVTLGDEYKLIQKGIFLYISNGITIKDMDGNTILSSTDTTYNNSCINIVYMGEYSSNSRWKLTKVDSTFRQGFVGTFLMLGDDYCHGHYDTYTYGYGGIIKETNPYMTLTNLGRNGYSIAKVNTNSIVSVLDTEIAGGSTAAYNTIILQGGYIDYLNNYALGVYDTTTKTGFDETTTYGAFESIISKCKTKWSTSKIYYLIPHNLNIDKLNNIYDKLKDICKKWNVVVIDLRELSSMDINNLSIKCVNTGETSEGTEGDGIFPNRNGYLNYYVDAIVKTIKGGIF